MRAQVLSNLETIGEMIGHLKGISAGLNDDMYTEGLIKAAHSQTTSIFDVAAASAGKAGAIPHMFEFGTMGITRGKPVFHDPTIPAARLWEHDIVGRGGQQDIMFRIRPATMPNPVPTTEETGVPSKYLRKLSRRNYKFVWKALVMETGSTVTIRPKNANFLFVPFYGQPPKDPRNNRGFMMHRGPITTVPGASTKGQFSAIWMGWWSATGQQIMSEHMERTVTRDVEIAEAEMSKSVSAQSALKPVQATNVVGAITSGFKKAESGFGRITKTLRSWRTK